MQKKFKHSFKCDNFVSNVVSKMNIDFEIAFEN